MKVTFRNTTTFLPLLMGFPMPGIGCSLAAMIDGLNRNFDEILLARAGDISIYCAFLVGSAAYDDPKAAISSS
ncbi:hypothetical protein [Novosphingobium sediminis]|uniref:hypothetical protein n=1 Tax=Novosphingobium sediminis TaxID=707214 RepID=UPI0011BEF787|nr:hypothetical protein [Novosphingobium sediminis]